MTQWSLALWVLASNVAKLRFLTECFSTWGYIVSQQMRSFELVHEEDTLTVIYAIFKVCWLWVGWNASLCVWKLKDLSLEIGLLVLVQGTILNSAEKPFSSSIVLLPFCHCSFGRNYPHKYSWSRWMQRRKESFIYAHHSLSRQRGKG